jgi:hypothetical protein
MRITRVNGGALKRPCGKVKRPSDGFHCEQMGVFMKKLAVMMAAVSAIAAMIGASDACAQSWGRRGANVRCTNGGVVQGRWYCNLKHAPPGEWNNYRSTGRYTLRHGMQGR